MPRRLHPLLAKLLLSAASLGMCLLVLEIAARVHYYTRGGGKEMRERASYFLPDPRLGWRKKPGARVTYDRREYTVEVAINSQGLRDEERGYAKPEWTFRVLALGDSFIEGFTVDLEDTVSKRLERRLASSTCPTEVLNGGTAGYSTDQQYLFYREEGVRYAPDVVVLFFFYNDVLFNALPNYWGLPKPRLEPGPEGLRIANEPVPPPRLKERSPEDPRTSRKPLTGSAAWRWVRERLLRGAPKTFDALARLGLWEPATRDTPVHRLKAYKRHRNPQIEAGWNMTDAILAALARDVQAQGSRLLVAYIPSRMEVSEADWELSKLRYSFDEKWDRGLVLERLREVARSGDFPVLDLTPALRAAHGDVVGRVYYQFDGHWNARGHDTAAAAVQDFLRKEGWLPDRCAAEGG